MKENLKSELNRHGQLVELERSSGFISDYYTLYVDGKEKHVYKDDLNSAISDFEKWSH